MLLRVCGRSLRAIPGVLGCSCLLCSGAIVFLSEYARPFLLSHCRESSLGSWRIVPSSSGRLGGHLVHRQRVSCRDTPRSYHSILRGVLRLGLCPATSSSPVRISWRCGSCKSARPPRPVSGSVLPC